METAMEPWPETRNTLLARLYDAEDQAAWAEFSRLYGPLIYRVARRRGLQDCDAQDIAQRVLWIVSQSASDWREGNLQGRFRGWLKRVSTNAALNLLQREAKHWGSGKSTIHDLLYAHPRVSSLPLGISLAIWPIHRAAAHR